MKKTAHVQRRFNTEHRILDKLAGFLPVGQPVSGMSYPAVAERIGEAAHAVLLAKKTMEDAGILRTVLDYPKGMSGRVSIWEMRLPLAVAHEEMSREHERQLERPSRKAQRRSNLHQDGDSAALTSLRVPRLDEAEALLKEARTYVSRLDWARQHLREMKDAGITVEEGSVTVRRDERLEHIAQVLPAVDVLAQERDRLSDQVSRWISGPKGGRKPPMSAPPAH